MTQLEHFKKTMAHAYTGKFLYRCGFIQSCREKLLDYLGKDSSFNIEKEFGIFAFPFIQLKEPAGYKPPDFSSYFSDMEIPKGAFINAFGLMEVPGSMYHFTRYISPLRNVRTLAEIEDFYIDTYDSFTDGHMAEAVNSLHEQGLVAAASCGMMYEDSWQMRGYEQFLEDMLLEPEHCENLLDRVCERNLRAAVSAANAGIDLLFSGDDVANQRTLMFSIENWRRFMKPRWEKVFKAVKKINPNIAIWYHSDGNIEDIIPELIEIGVDILNPVQPECLDPLMVKKKYGGQLVIDGAIGTQSVMPFGTPQQVRDEVRKMKECLGYDGAYIISPTHVLEPDVPPQNIIAFLEESAK